MPVRMKAMLYIGLWEDLTAGYFRLNFYTFFTSLMLTYLKSFFGLAGPSISIFFPLILAWITLYCKSGPRKPLSEAFLTTLASNRTFSSLVFSLWS